MRRSFSYRRTIVLCFLLHFTIPLDAIAESLVPATGCFTRSYDPTHLSRHLHQLVTNVRLSIRESAGNAEYRYAFALQIQKRGKNKILKTQGLCTENGTKKLRCFVECDGGGVDVSINGDRAMMYLDRIRMASCGNDIDTAEEVSGSIDDREFRLDRMGNHMCSNMAFD